jgi:2,3-bisphosphoglycerate-independent phosphoglycerate mutase
MSEFKLSTHESIPPPKGPVMVCILDGYGENEYTDEFNAVTQAKTPCFDKLRENKERFRYAFLFFRN